MPEKVLFVEDEQDLGSLVKQYLETKGFDIDWYDNPRNALKAFRDNNEHYGICLLDVQMPQKSGFELAENIQDINEHLPFVFLTARTEKKDRLAGLKIGAADYICKPFDIDELALKLKNIMKMTSGHVAPKPQSSVFMIGDLLYNREQLTITLPDKKTIKLTNREAELLLYFYQHKNKRIRKEEILVRIWGENDYFLGKSLDVFISRLRKILAKSDTITLSNVYGAGYIFNISEEAE